MSQESNATLTLPPPPPSGAFFPFYVTGLPRTRTAWLANMLTNGITSVCLHEPLARLGSRDVYEAKPAMLQAMITRWIEITPAVRFRGLADSGLHVALPELPAQIPGPIVVIHRDPERVIDSLVAYSGWRREQWSDTVYGMFNSLCNFITKHENRMPVLEVEFEEVSERMPEIWAHVFEGKLTFPRTRFEELDRYRIDIPFARLFEDSPFVDEMNEMVAESGDTLTLLLDA